MPSLAIEKPITEVDQKSKAEDEPIEASFTTKQYGVWQMWIPNHTRRFVGNFYVETLTGLYLFRVFAMDVYRIAPGLFFFWILTRLCSGMKTSVTLYTSNRLLTMIEASLSNGQANVEGIVASSMLHIFCMTTVSLLEWWSDQIEPQIELQIKRHFERRLFRAKISQDLPTSQVNSSKQDVTSVHAWRALLEGMELATETLSMISQLLFVVQVSKNGIGGPIFALCCIANPAVSSYVRTWWTKSFISHAKNPHYLRLRALMELGKDQYRQDIISGNVVEYILQEYEKAQNALGNESDDHIFSQMNRQRTPFHELLYGILDELPMAYYAANAILSTKNFSIANIAILQQTSSSLRMSFQSLCFQVKRISEHFEKIKNLYDALEVKNIISEGNLPYPQTTSDGSNETGMAIEVRDLFFEYPGSKSTQKALSNISFSVRPGQLVVIVGANGSGKSTLVKLLNRLYNPTSGSILIDGTPMSSYKMFDLREATADLSQDHNIYPLSIRENIGLGYPPSASDSEAVLRSAELGGALGFVSKFESAFDTTLQPISTALMRSIGGNNRDQLKKLLDKLERKVDISGGEKQRLIASRTFMRLHSKAIRCCTVDEPSSALDPEGEMELFQRLREAKGGKTMFFVTHRFGHLTKYADLIICMKEGKIVEMGTHNSLIKQEAEYARLYNVQAGAFSSDST